MGDRRARVERPPAEVLSRGGPLRWSGIKLHGRDREVALLGEVLARAAQGRGGVAFVEGEGGIGKTRLLGEVLGRAEQQGLEVVHGRSEQLERLRPFGALVDAFGVRGSPDPGMASLARLVAPEPEEAGGLALAGTARFRGAEGFLELIEERCAAGPVLVALEDLHWADEATVLTIRMVARRVGALPVVVVGTLRPVPVVPELTSLIDTCVEEGGLHLRLGPLAPELVQGLVTEALGAAPGPRLCDQLAGAAGNPLFVIELARSLVQENLVSVAAGVAEVGQVQAPPSLRLTILRRLAVLSEPTLELLRLAAVLGPAFELTDVAAVAARPVRELVGAVDEAVRAGVLGENGGRLCFRHDLVHEALYGELPLAVRAGLHREVARTRAASGASALQVAQHLLLGAAPGDAQAAAWLRRAAGEAASRAPAVAAELLARAVDLTEGSTCGGDVLLAELVMALLWSGRVVEAEAMAGRVLERPHDPAVEGALRLARGRALFILGRVEEGLGVLDAGYAGAALKPGERAQLQADRAYGYAMSGRFGEAEPLARSAREAAEAAGEDLAWCVATSALSLTAFFQGDLSPAIDLGRQAVGRAEMSPSALARRYPVHYFLAVCLAEADRFVEADEVVLAGRWMNQEWGTTWVLPMLEWVSAAAGFLTADWDDALVAAEAGLGMAGEGGSRQGLACAKGLAELVTVYRTGSGGARLDTDASGSQPKAPPSGVLDGLAGVVEGLLVEVFQGPAAALAVLEDAWKRATDAGSHVDYRILGPELVRLAVATGAVERARTVADAVKQVANRMGTMGAQAAAQRCHGLLEADPEALLAAGAAYASAGRPLERAFAHEEAGAAMAASGRAGEAVAVLQEAVAVYDKLGATLPVTRVEARLRLLGPRPRQEGRRRRPREGWDSLTPSEQRVVDLVAKGLTNLQVAETLFVSRHTVESHVSHVFAKLRIGSRSELAARAVARRQDQP